MPQPTSKDIFMKHIKTKLDGSYEVSGVVSKECYFEWLLTRKSVPKDAPHAFRKALTGTCRGDIGLEPFGPVLEPNVLALLRKKAIWKCFKDTKIKIGERGFQTKGYWEKQQMNIKSIQAESIKPKRQRQVNEVTVSEIETEIIELQNVINSCNFQINTYILEKIKTLSTL